MFQGGEGMTLITDLYKRVPMGLAYTRDECV